MFPRCFQDKVHTLSRGTQAVLSGLISFRACLPVPTALQPHSLYPLQVPPLPRVPPTAPPDHPSLFPGFLFTLTCYLTISTQATVSPHLPWLPVLLSLPLGTTYLSIGKWYISLSVSSRGLCTLKPGQCPCHPSHLLTTAHCHILAAWGGRCCGFTVRVTQSALLHSVTTQKFHPPPGTASQQRGVSHVSVTQHECVTAGKAACESAGGREFY